MNRKERLGTSDFEPVLITTPAEKKKAKEASEGVLASKLQEHFEKLKEKILGELGRSDYINSIPQQAGTSTPLVSELTKESLAIITSHSGHILSHDVLEHEEKDYKAKEKKYDDLTKDIGRHSDLAKEMKKFGKAASTENLKEHIADLKARDDYERARYKLNDTIIRSGTAEQFTQPKEIIKKTDEIKVISSTRSEIDHLTKILTSTDEVLKEATKPVPKSNQPSSETIVSTPPISPQQQSTSSN